MIILESDYYLMTIFNVFIIARVTLFVLVFITLPSLWAKFALSEMMTHNKHDKIVGWGWLNNSWWNVIAIPASFHLCSAGSHTICPSVVWKNRESRKSHITFKKILWRTHYQKHEDKLCFSHNYLSVDTNSE